MSPRESSNSNNSNNSNNNNNNDNNSIASTAEMKQEQRKRLLNKKKKSSNASSSSLQRTSMTSSANNQERPMKTYIPTYLQRVIIPYHGDFCQTPLFHPKLIVQLMAEGFLPIATNGALLPKLHLHRSVIVLQQQQQQQSSQLDSAAAASNSTNAAAAAPSGLHSSKSTRKKASKFTLTFNQAFREVVRGCHEQHEQCWLYPPLVEAFHAIQQDEATQNGFVVQQNETIASPTRQPCRVRLYSVECWNATTKQLVAGELGYTVGSCYTSLTGFSNESGAGSVQLAALGQWLVHQGFTLWDLGMDMEYKRKLGATLMPRWQFVQHIHNVRCQYRELVIPDGKEHLNCRAMIDGNAGPRKGTAVAPCVSPSRQRRKSHPDKRSPKKVKVRAAVNTVSE